MSRMSNAAADDNIELIDEDNLSLQYRLRKCGATRVLITALVMLLVIGVIAGVIVILRFMSKGTKKAPFENPSSGLCKSHSCHSYITSLLLTSC